MSRAPSTGHRRGPRTGSCDTPTDPLLLSGKQQDVAAQLEILQPALLQSWERFEASGAPGYGVGADAVAWAVLALKGFVESPALTRLLGELHSLQREDGRVPVRADSPEAYWPTSLAALAFHEGGERFQGPRDRALDFLLANAGVHHPRTEKTPVSHDTDLVGWPWVAGSAAWVEPTALALLALRRCGRGEHPRARAARDLLFDRQLPDEGWNHGNVEVLGKRFPSVVTSTGLVLLALADQPDDARLQAATRFLVEAPTNTSLSIAWQLLGQREVSDRIRGERLYRRWRDVGLASPNADLTPQVVLALGGGVDLRDDLAPEAAP